MAAAAAESLSPRDEFWSELDNLLVLGSRVFKQMSLDIGGQGPPVPAFSIERNKFKVAHDWVRSRFPNIRDAGFIRRRDADATQVRRLLQAQFSVESLREFHELFLHTVSRSALAWGIDRLTSRVIYLSSRPANVAHGAGSEPETSDEDSN